MQVNRSIHSIETHLSTERERITHKKKIKMATAFRIHEDIENAPEINRKGNKKTIVGGKNNGVANDKIEKHQQQQQRSTFAILNNVQNDGGRTGNTTHAQKTVRAHSNILSSHIAYILFQRILYLFIVLLS